jgi:hypothetical protein
MVRALRWVWGKAAFALLGVSILIFVGAMAVAAGGAPVGAVGAAPTSSGPQWIALKSEAPGDILAAVRQSRLFNVNRSENGDYLKDLSHLDVPRLVTELRLSASSQGIDCYVVPILDRSGNTVGAAVAWLNPAHTATYVGYIRAYDAPLLAWTGTLPSSAQAVRITQVHHHIGLRAAAQPRLVYFPFDFHGRWAGTVKWNAGGEGPDTPVWLVPGADGKDHVVGADGHAYYVRELPISPLAH